MTKGEYVTVCPKCGSTNVTFEENAAYVYTGLLNQFKQCHDCGYHGPLFPQVPRSEVKEPLVPQKVKKVEGVQTAFGRGQFMYILYVGIPFLILILLIFFFLQK
jgi:predicted RNA-binding Zn-ribbon protein involved in translation (DUF1610 family)